MGNEVSAPSIIIAFDRGDVIRRNLQNSNSEGEFGFHYGVYIGDDTVIHLLGKKEGICKCTLREFSVGYKVSKDCVEDSKPPEKIATTAEYFYKNKEEFGEFNIVTNNCEHFAIFCATGKKKSKQVQIAVEVVVSNTVKAIAISHAMYTMREANKRLLTKMQQNFDKQKQGSTNPEGWWQ